MYTRKLLPALQGHYVFGDFVTGRLFAVGLPSDRKTRVPAVSLGEWPMLPVTFGRDAQGELYVADYTRGGIYKLVPRTKSVTPAR